MTFDELVAKLLIIMQDAAASDLDFDDALDEANHLREGADPPEHIERPGRRPARQEPSQSDREELEREQRGRDAETVRDLSSAVAWTSVSPTLQSYASADATLTVASIAELRDQIYAAGIPPAYYERWNLELAEDADVWQPQPPTTTDPDDIPF